MLSLCSYLEEEPLRQREQLGKDPEARMCLVCLRNAEEVEGGLGKGKREGEWWETRDERNWEEESSTTQNLGGYYSDLIRASGEAIGQIEQNLSVILLGGSIISPIYK